MAPQTKRRVDGLITAPKTRLVSQRQQTTTTMFATHNNHEKRLADFKQAKASLTEESESYTKDSKTDLRPPSSKLRHSNSHSNVPYILAARHDPSRFAASLQTNLDELFLKATALDRDLHRNLRTLPEPAWIILARWEALVSGVHGERN